jgi:hypothetical protein
MWLQSLFYYCIGFNFPYGTLGSGTIADALSLDQCVSWPGTPPAPSLLEGKA